MIKPPKILFDTLTNASGEYSRKSVTWFTGTCLLVWLVIYGTITKEFAPEYVFWSVLSLILGLAGASVYDKIRNKNSNNNE